MTKQIAVRETMRDLLVVSTFGFWAVLPLIAIGFLGSIMFRQKLDRRESAR